MKLEQSDVNLVKKVLWPNETVVGTVRQSRILPGGSVVVPTSVIITNERIIIVNREALGIRHDYESIPYSSITSVRLEQGVITSSVFIRVQGYDTDKGLLKNGKEEGEIYGLHGGDARDLANYLNQRLEAKAEVEERAEESEAGVADRSGEMDSKVGGFIFCSKCGAKNPAGASFCTKCGAKIVSAHQ